jgi:phage-related protein
MSEALFYDRTRNISGIAAPAELSDLSLTPVYGSEVVFSAKNHSYQTDDHYYNLIPMSVNSLTADFNLRYDVNEANARGLANFFESKSGYRSFGFTPDDSGIYKTVSGYCNNYAINFVNNQHYEVAANIAIDDAPTLLNWSGGSFANLPFTDYSFALYSVAYKKYDVVYADLNQNKLDNFYYCSGDHSSTRANSPTGESSMWTRKFFFEPDIGTQNNVEIKVDAPEYQNSFLKRVLPKGESNIATFDMDYTYSNITNKQLKSMLQFLENKGGYRRFEHQIPSVYNQPKVYYCPEWKHTWNYYDSNTLTVKLVEDPLGVLPTGT